MPASNSTVGLMISRSRRPAYCDTKRAEPTPKGTATSMATNVTFRVPTTRGQTAYLGISETGCHTCSGASYPGHCRANHIFASVTSFQIAES